MVCNLNGEPDMQLLIFNSAPRSPTVGYSLLFLPNSANAGIPQEYTGSVSTLKKLNREP